MPSSPYSTNHQASGIRLDFDAAVDMHLHTYASDGSWSPSALIDDLVARGIVVASVCDHDTQDSVLEAIDLGQRRGVRIVPGTEVTVRWGGRQWHLLVYGIRPDDSRPEARAFLKLMAEHDQRFMALAVDARRRVERSGRPIPRMAEETGGRKPMPVHVLRAMIAAGHVPSLKEAAELVVALGGNFTYDTPLEDVVAAAHQAAGVCILAHPGRGDLGPALTAKTLDRILKATPLHGIEGHYRTYTDADTARYRRIADSRGLLIGAGSDSHGPGVPVDPRPWRAVWARDLLAQLGFDVDPPPDGVPWAPGMDPRVAKPTKLKRDEKRQVVQV
ncbi:MAG: PHP domain-containing protein [Thermomicrobiales bacterium]